MWSNEYDEKYYELANIYLHFGEFLSDVGQPELGKEYLGMALQNYKQNYGSIHPLTAACYESMARFYLDQGDWEGALDHIHLALHSISGKFNSTDPYTNPSLESSSHELTFLKILATKTIALEKASDHAIPEREKTEYLNAALATQQLSVDLLYHIRNSFLSSESRIYLNSKQKDLFARGIQLNLDMFHLTGKKKFEEAAFMMAARGKAGELLFEMNSKEWLYLESLNDPLPTSAADLKREMDHLSNLIQTASLEMIPDSLHIARMQDQLFQTRDSFNKRMGELRSDFPNISQFESTQTDFTLKQIRRSLRRNETLIEYFISDTPSSDRKQLYAFVVTKRDCQVHQSNLDSTFQKNLQTINRNLHDFVPYEETPERFDSLKQALFAMYEDLIQQLEPSLNETNLIIVPDEELNYIPFDALISKLAPESITNYAGISYLLHKYNISYVYNSQLIAHNPTRFWRFPEVTAWIPGYATAKENTFDRLKGAEEEVQDIFDITSGKKVQKDLAKQDLMDELENNSILHLAMHSLASDNTVKSPYFILDSVQDPLLSHQMHDYEINALRITSPMVVLSSCETAGGELHEGEGIMSLSRSFLQAGASSVVHSLWPVEDVKSRDIMVGFYREIKKGHSKSTALSRVKKQYIAEQPPFYTHPYYWAALQITGNTSPLHAQRRASLGLGSVLLVLLIFYGIKRRSFLRRN
jgi:CHAT domain-containing protein